jgi:hypothetical protein
MTKDTYPYPQEDLEFAGAWGHAAEKSVTLAGVVKRLQIRAGELYVKDKFRKIYKVTSRSPRVEMAARPGRHTMPDMNEKLRAKIAKWRRDFTSSLKSSGMCGLGRIAALTAFDATIVPSDLESLLTSSEPPGSVAGDEYEVAARRCVEFLLIPICGVNPNSKEELIRLIGGEFRAACGSREAELETKLLALCDEWDDNQTYVMPTNTRGGWDSSDENAHVHAECAKKIRAAITDARAKQGKETRT